VDAPVTSAWSIFRLGVGSGSTRPGRDDPVPPQVWEDAKKVGVYVLDDHGRLLPAIRDTVRICADRGVALSFGHLAAGDGRMAEECTALGHCRAFIDHPFRVFELRALAMAGRCSIRFATWDELSPCSASTRKTWSRPSAPSTPTHRLQRRRHPIS
jgi:hypothetical protein